MGTERAKPRNVTAANAELIAAYSGAPLRAVNHALAHGLAAIKDPELRARIKAAMRSAKRAAA